MIMESLFNFGTTVIPYQITVMSRAGKNLHTQPTRSVIFCHKWLNVLIICNSAQLNLHL